MIMVLGHILRLVFAITCMLTTLATCNTEIKHITITKHATSPPPASSLDALTQALDLTVLHGPHDSADLETIQMLESTKGTADLTRKTAWYAFSASADQWWSKYEVRISYPATTPCSFAIEVIGDIDAAFRTHNVTVPSDVREAVAARSLVFARVNASYTGVSRVIEGEDVPVVYNIALEQLVLGVVPVHAVRLVLVLVAVIGACLVAVPRIDAWIGGIVEEKQTEKRKMKLL